MSLSIYESVFQPILRRLSRSSNDSDNPRVTASNGTGVLARYGNTFGDSLGLEEEEVDVRPSHLAHVVWDPRIEPRHVTLPGTEHGVLVDEPAALPFEDYTDGIHRSREVTQGTVPAGVARGYPGHGDGETSSNPLHGVPHSFRSPASSVSSSAQSMHGVEIEQAREDSSIGAVQEGRERSVSSLISPGAEGPLPADDGMSILRKRILDIQSAESSQEEKSRSMHALMTERYNLSQPSLHSPRPRSNSPASFSSADGPTTPRSNLSYTHTTFATSPPTSLSLVANAADPFNLSPEDREPTYFCKPRSPSTCQDRNGPVLESANDAGESTEDANSFGCAHYKRNIKLQCSACGGWYTCRFCHDEIEDHSLNRRETKYMLCMFCGCAQTASHICAECGERAACYYCDVCKLWDDDPRRSIYHCNDCGICRVGQGLGKDFFHCKVGHVHTNCPFISTYSQRSRHAACAFQFGWQAHIAV